MKCQVTGCQNVGIARQVAGVFHGTYLKLQMNCCEHHTADEIQRTESKLVDRYLTEEIKCDPMADVTLVTRMRYGAA